jgi:RNA polymerase sigma-70 factor (ECF subfamily)
VHVNDAALIQAVEAAQAGDERAFEALFRANRDSLYSLAMHFLHDADVAADVTQEAFVRAWEQLPRLRDPGAFGGWLRAMAMNLVRDHFRRYRPQDELDESDPPPGDDPGPEETLVDDERDRSVREAVLSLPEHQRTIVTMHYLEGRSVAEIMSALGLAKGTVVSRLSRGRENLRRRLAPYIDDVGER